MENKNLTITRIFDAPRELVFKAWADPEYMKRWWGPKYFTAPVCKIDFRVGGKYLFCMRSPEGQDFWNTGIYKEIINNERIVFTNCFCDPQGNIVPATYYGMSGDFALEMLTSVFFEEQNGKTKLTLLHEGLPAGEMTTNTNQGWNQSFDKLDESLKTQPVVIERTYNAPVAKVWKAITDINALKQWYFDLAEFKPEVGFEFQFEGVTKEGAIKKHLCKITEVVAGKKIAYSWRYVGLPGNSLVTWELFTEGNKTRLKLTHAGLETFAMNGPGFAKTGFAGGWTHFVGTALKEFVEAQPVK